MQTITVISGQTREGKTQELIGKFINFCSACTEIVNESKNVSKVKNMDLIKPYYITCEESANIIYERILETYPNVKGIGEIIEVSSINDMFNIINEKIEEKDCIFFIDMPYTISMPDSVIDAIPDFHKKITILQDTYPNNKCKYSFDVIYTRSRSLTRSF